MSKLVIRFAWQEEIVARDYLNALCRISELANLLYPDLPLAKQREAALFADGGAIIKRIADESARVRRESTAALIAWQNRGATE